MVSGLPDDAEALIDLLMRTGVVVQRMRVVKRLAMYVLSAYCPPN